MTGAACAASDGTSVDIGARVVVLASGDYAASEELKARFISDAVARVDAMNPTATGDGHLMALPLGAEVLNGDVLSGPTLRFVPPPRASLDRLLPPSRMLAKAMRLALHYAPERALRPFVLRFTTTSMAPELDLFAKGALLVNRDGARIAGAPATLGLAIAAEPEKIGYVVMDAPLARRFTAWPDFIATAPGVAYAYLDDFRRTRRDIFHQADSLTRLASELSMDGTALATAVAAHNAEAPAPIATPPFYALGPAKSYIVLTDGGLAVNQALQVLGTGGKPIAGLYAAGSVGQGGLILKGHGHHIGWAFTSGRIAGRHAAEEAGRNT